MKLIALETSTHHLSVALWRDGSLIERAAEIANGGSEYLLPWTNQLLAEAGMSFSGLDAIAFGAGPGGFTGLRLACGVAQGLAFGLGLPVLAVPTLEALALASYTRGTEYLYPCLDARMNEVYCAAYKICEGITETIQEAVAVHPKLAAVPSGFGWIGCGDGFAAYPDMLAGSMTALRPACWPTAAAVARLAAPRLENGQGMDAGAALPLYVRDKVALTTVERQARGGLK